MEVLSELNRKAISKDIDYTIHSWIEQRINNVESNEGYLSIKALEGDHDLIKKYLNTFLNNRLFFDTVQVYVYDYYFYANTKLQYDFRKGLNQKDFIENKMVIKRPWLVNTKKTKTTTMTIVEEHGTLLEKTINICTPVIRNNDVKAILCGIIKVNEILEKVKKLHFPKNAYYFISDKKGNVLTKISEKKRKAIKEIFSKNILDMNSLDYQESLLNKDILTIRKFNHFDWYIGVAIDNSVINSKILHKFTTNSIILFLLFFILIIIINSSHEFLRRRVEKQKEEYEYILAHRSRMSEIGELISGINHQLYQPINSLSLLLSNTLFLQKHKKLDEETLNENLIMCQKATKLMSNTIKIFRNFYRCNESVTEFSLEEAINTVLQVMHIDLVRNNILIEMDYSSKENIITSVENFLQQILLVLIQNAKEALLLSDNFDKRILIKVNVEDKYTYIDVIDKADGISAEVMPTLFKNMKSSKKNLGSGIGLYFAKKLAKEKLGGDLILQKSSSPTTFRLSFLNKLQTKEPLCIVKP
ncbi:MAG: ATP-binding protein [Halarcobacter sp.]